MKRLDYYWYKPFENKEHTLLPWYRKSGILASVYDLVSMYLMGITIAYFFGNGFIFSKNYYPVFTVVAIMSLFKNYLNKRK
jgi:hypothetical protein